MSDNTLEEVQAASGLYAALSLRLIEVLADKGIIDRSDLEMLAETVAEFAGGEPLPDVAEGHRGLLLSALAAFAEPRRNT
ncbi:hypothetical protein AI27_06495 [Sphingomonas sp. BHC-A]|nr:hypothetical protein AI27_06495 [Sphingomonas sp. BHC-A]